MEKQKRNEASKKKREKYRILNNRVEGGEVKRVWSRGIALSPHRAK